MSSNFIFPQNLFPTRVEKLRQLKTRTDIKVMEVEKGIYNIQFSNGQTIIKNTNDYKPPEENKINYSPTYDSTIIDLRTVDTTLYYQNYSLWQQVNVARISTGPVIVGDLNNNNLPEIYGQRKDYDFIDFSYYITALEKNSSGGFDSVYGYDSTVIAKSIYDVDKDGMAELHLMRIPTVDFQYLFYKKTNYYSLATELSFSFKPWVRNGQENDNRFGDWDGDDFTDQIFIKDSEPHSINIFEYNPANNNFDSVYQLDLMTLDLYYGGFGIGDFDQDEKTEFFSSSVHGKILAVENNDNNSYNVNWQGSVQTYNAYLLAETEDIDSNGKPEVWVGGDAYYSGLGVTRITLFEGDGNNNYQAVGRIDLIGVFSFYAGNIQVLDVDKDGKNEIMICIDGNLIILKFVGSPNHQSYELFYIKQNDLSLSGIPSEYYAASMYDFTGDGKEDIIISMFEYTQGLGMRIFSNIYKSNLPDKVTDVSYSSKNFELQQNYPNPFNPSTKINFTIPEYSNVTLKIYDLLGKEITTVMKEELSPGNYFVKWEGTDNNNILLSTGVYLIRLTAISNSKTYTQTIKALLLK